MSPQQLKDEVAQRVDELNRLTNTAGAVQSLVEIFETADEPLQEALTRVVHAAQAAIPDADAVSITAFSQPRSRTAAYTDERALHLDDSQCASGLGPCLEAARTRSPVRVSMGLDDQRWSEYLAACRTEGILTSLSVPLIVGPLCPTEEGNSLEGSLNVYSRTLDAFDPFDQVLMSVFATSASQAITNARRWQRSREMVSQLEAALVSRSAIDQAKGILRAVHGCSADEAFAMLVRQSQRDNAKLHTVADRLLDSVSANAKGPR